MAFNASPTWDCFIGARDDNGDTSGFSFMLPAGLTDTEAAAAAAVVRDAYIALTNAYVNAMVLRKTYLNDAADPHNANSSVRRKLSVTFADATGRYKSSIEVPSPTQAIEQVGTTVVDPSQALVAAFTAAMINTGLGEGNSPVTYNGADITQVLGDIQVTFRERGKQA